MGCRAPSFEDRGNTSMSEKFYITTPIYYVNDAPHIGHAYTTIAADVLARFFRVVGRDVRFLTGTDEHGVKIVKAAQENNMSPQEMADSVVVHFKEMWKTLNISNDDFIRTSQDRHKNRVGRIVELLLERDEIYLGSYEGWYDEGQEEFVTDSVARANDFKSAINEQPLVRYSEPSYFFRLSKWAPKLIEYIEANPGFVMPELRRNEVLSRLRGGVDDLSFSRLAEKLGGWGVRLPNDPEHTVYVWIDALFNYLTATGLPEIGDEHDNRFGRYWPADVHLIGKDILWFHAVYWPCLLMALDFPLPKRVFAHGWWTSEGRKMSKSLGNFISAEKITELCKEYSRDVLRYFLLREIAFGSDGDFSRNSFRERYHAELANGVGNLLSRTTNMINRYFNGELPAAEKPGPEEQPVIEAAANLSKNAVSIMERLAFQEYLEAVQQLVNATNKYIEVTEPFKLARDDSQRARLGAILNTCAQATRITFEWLYPYMPESAVLGLEALGLDEPEPGSLLERTAWGKLPAGTAIKKASPLYPRKE